MCCFFALLTREIFWFTWLLIPNLATSVDWRGRSRGAWPAGEVGRRPRQCWDSVACWGQKAVFCALLEPARLTSTVLLQETLGPHYHPLLSSSSMTGFWPVGHRAVTPQMLQPIHYNMSVSIQTFMTWLRVRVPVCVHVCVM